MNKRKKQEGGDVLSDPQKLMTLMAALEKQRSGAGEAGISNPLHAPTSAQTLQQPTESGGISMSELYPTAGTEDAQAQELKQASVAAFSDSKGADQVPMDANPMHAAGADPQTSSAADIAATSSYAHRTGFGAFSGNTGASRNVTL